jgi:crotonobetainyl-CoA:carnitine CoA-transferase CaiB-like acyl-CoA transferase
MTTIETAFSQLMNLYGRESPGFVTFHTEAPALATRFAADEAASAAIAAGATVAADLWALRTGERQLVEVSSRRAAASLNGFRYQRFADASRAPPMFDADPSVPATAANGFKVCGDGRHVYLHPSFPPGAARLLRALACNDTPDSVNAACLARSAQEIEDAVAAERGCAAVVRSPTEWDESEQGRVLGARPVVEVVQIADSQREPLPTSGDMPLSGLRVLDLTRVLAGPTCARTLAQYGAEILHLAAPHLPSFAGFVSDTNHGKLSAWLDLRTDAARQHLRDLIRGTDVFSEGYRTGAMERLGFGLLDLARIRPGIIYTSINCYGHEGPWRGRAGWEQLAQSVTGMAYLHGGEQGPKLLPGAVTDYTTGFLAAFGSLVALHRRALQGGSYLVRVSLCQTGVWLRRLGIAGQERLDRVQPITDHEIQRFSVQTETGYGLASYLAPPVHMTATPARWKRPVVPLGTHPAEWPPL